MLGVGHTDCRLALRSGLARCCAHRFIWRQVDQHAVSWLSFTYIDMYLGSRPTIWVPDGVLDHLLARETALARPNMPLLDRFFAPSFP